MRKAIIGAILLSAIVSSAAEAALFVDKFQGNGAGGGGLTRADQVIAGSWFTPNQSLGNVFNTINFSDSGSYGTFPDPTNLWPMPGLNDDFVVHIYGYLNVTTAGNYTFTTSNDDGVRLRIDGGNVIVNDSYHPTQYYSGTTFLGIGQHTIDLVFFEGSVQGTLELIVQQGAGPQYLLGNPSFTQISTSTTAVAAVPEPTSMLTLTGLALSFGAGNWLRRRRKNALLSWTQMRSN
jgi:hypothetical protein